MKKRYKKNTIHSSELHTLAEEKKRRNGRGHAFIYRNLTGWALGWAYRPAHGPSPHDATIGTGLAASRGELIACAAAQGAGVQGRSLSKVVQRLMAMREWWRGSLCSWGASSGSPHWAERAGDGQVELGCAQAAGENSRPMARRLGQSLVMSAVLAASASITLQSLASKNAWNSRGTFVFAACSLPHPGKFAAICKPKHTRAARPAQSKALDDGHLVTKWTTCGYWAAILLA